MERVFVYVCICMYCVYVMKSAQGSKLFLMWYSDSRRGAQKCQNVDRNRDLDLKRGQSAEVTKLQLDNGHILGQTDISDSADTLATFADTLDKLIRLQLLYTHAIQRHIFAFSRSFKF